MTAFGEIAAARLSRRHALEIWSKLIRMAISGEQQCREYRLSETTLLLYQAQPKRNAALKRQVQDLPGAARGMATAVGGGCRGTGARS
jgi:hypothetical protein